MQSTLRNTTITVLSLVVALAALLVAVGQSSADEVAIQPSAATAIEADSRDHRHGADAPADERSRGLVFDGLTEGDSDGPCVGSYEASLASGHPLCTHGPDPAPEGIDVTIERDTGELAAATETSSATSSGGSVRCIGDGVTGNRVQAVYAVASDRTDRYASIAPSIAQWAADVDGVFSASAAATGADRHVRYVTNSDCSLSVLHVVLSPSGDDNIGNTANELEALGLDRPDRKYIVWTDATIYCGIAYVIGDDRPGQDNLNNGRYAGYARIDSGCWGRTNSTEAHELMHTMGGVQRSAPHGTSQYHCSDESDRMCYNDGSVTMTYPCASTHEATFDCGHDDYFSTSPAPTSYLDTHWNVANSSFLEAAATAPPTTADTTPPPAPTGLAASPGNTRVALTWIAPTAPDVASYRVYRNGALLTATNDVAFTDTAVVNGTAYTYEVVAVDTAGNASPPSTSVAATPTARVHPRKPAR